MVVCRGCEGGGGGVVMGWGWGCCGVTHTLTATLAATPTATLDATPTTTTSNPPQPSPEPPQQRLPPKDLKVDLVSRHLRHSGRPQHAVPRVATQVL